MEHNQQKFIQQQELLLLKKEKLRRKAHTIMLCEWVLVLVGIAYVAAVLYFWSAYGSIVQSWSTDLQILLGIGVLLGITPLIFITLVCEFYRDTLIFRASITEQAFDVSDGVQDAMREYFGKSLPTYSRHLNTFGLAHEALGISQEMSRDYDKAFSATRLALQTIDEHFGLAGIKHEALKARVLAIMLKQLLKILKQHQAVGDAAQADEKIAQTVVQLTERLSNLK